MTNKSTLCSNPCVRMFVDSLEYVFMKPREAGKFIAARMNVFRDLDALTNGLIELRVQHVDKSQSGDNYMQYLERLFGKNFVRGLSMFLYYLVDTSVTVKGLPARYDLIVVKVPYSIINDFLVLGSMDSNARVIAEKHECPTLLTRMLRKVIRCAYIQKPWMWFVLRRVYVSSAGAIVVSMVRPSNEAYEIESVGMEENREELDMGDTGDMQ